MSGGGGGYQQRPNRPLRSRVMNTTSCPSSGENTLDTRGSVAAAAALLYPPASTGFASVPDDDEEDDEDDDEMVCCQSNTIGDVAWADLISAGTVSVQMTTSFVHSLTHSHTHSAQ